MSLRSTILAVASICAYAVDAHITMAQPVPFGKPDNGPINKLQWPCKGNMGYTINKMNNMAVGEQQTLKFDGQAVHGGGSCQLSITQDLEPTPESKWKVIQSIEGGCPGIEGTVDVPFKLPDSVPNGKATFAWTWFAKLSGGPEMYMNCAPIEVTGGASDTSKFDALPDMLVANLPEVTDCKQEPSTVLKIPNPGSVLTGTAIDDTTPGTGSCGASGPSPEPSGGAGAPASSAAGGSPSAAPSSAGGNDGMYTPPAGAGATSAAATSAAAAPTSPAGGAASSAPAVSKPAVSSAAATGGAGGVFAPGASSAAPAASTQTTLVTVTGTPSTPSKTTAAASKPTATAPAAGTGASGAAPTSAPAAGGSSGTCTTNGAVVCNGPTQFGLCDNGSVVWQAVAAGTTCSNGTIQKRGYRGRIVRRNGLVGHVHKH